MKMAATPSPLSRAFDLLFTTNISWWVADLPRMNPKWSSKTRLFFLSFVCFVCDRRREVRNFVKKLAFCRKQWDRSVGFRLLDFPFWSDLCSCSSNREGTQQIGSINLIVQVKVKDGAMYEAAFHKNRLVVTLQPVKLWAGKFEKFVENSRW